MPDPGVTPSSSRKARWIVTCQLCHGNLWPAEKENGDIRHRRIHERSNAWSLGSPVPWFPGSEVFQRIQRPAVDADLKMQVRTGGDACGAYQRDWLTGADHLPGAHQEFGRMPIDGADAIAMIDDHRPAVPLVPPREGDPACPGGVDLRAVRGSDINPVVVVLPSPPKPG